jgi:cellobiose phosphorylase
VLLTVSPEPQFLEVVVVVVAVMLLNHKVVLAVQVVVVVVVVITIRYTQRYMDSIVNQQEITHTPEQTTQAVVAVEADTMEITPTALADVAVQELLLLDTNRKNYERNTKN